VVSDVRLNRPSTENNRTITENSARTKNAPRYRCWGHLIGGYAPTFATQTYQAPLAYVARVLRRLLSLRARPRYAWSAREWPETRDWVTRAPLRKNRLEGEGIEKPPLF